MRRRLRSPVRAVAAFRSSTRRRRGAGLSLTVETIRTKAGGEELRDSWEALLSTEGEPSPFPSPDWFACFLQDAECVGPFVLTSRADGRPGRIAPLCFAFVRSRCRRV